VLVLPILTGAGRELTRADAPATALALEDARTWPGGVVDR
jgi:hypothetical protein